MKQFTAALLLALLLLAPTGCQRSGTTDTSNPAASSDPAITTADAADPAETEAPSEPRRVDLGAVRDAIIQELELQNYLDMGPDLLLNLYGIHEEDYTQCAAFVTMAGIFPHEVVMMEAVDEEAADRIGEAMNKRLSEVMNQAARYDPENYALAQKCEVKREGLYVTLFLSPDSERMQAVFDGAE